MAGVESLKKFVAPLEQVVKMEHCLYTYTTTEDFIIDFHPQDKRIVIGSVCSGHGFKFGPLAGRVLAELVLRGKTTIPDFEAVRQRFAL